MPDLDSGAVRCDCGDGELISNRRLPCFVPASGTRAQQTKRDTAAHADGNGRKRRIVVSTIEVVFWSEALSFPAGHRAIDIRDTLKHPLNIAADAEPWVNGKRVGWGDRMHTGPLEFVKAAGSKGGGWATEEELPERFRPHLESFRRTHPALKDWCEGEPGVYLYREAAIYAEFGHPTADDVGREMFRFVALLGGQAGAPPASAAGASLPQNRVPHYDEELRRLTVGGQLIKKYHEPSPNQIAILIAFEEAGWPAVMDDPIPSRPGVDPKRRLRDAVAALNGHHKIKSIMRFHAENDGEAVSWELLDRQ